jgi:hypothetical protein
MQLKMMNNQQQIGEDENHSVMIKKSGKEDMKEER